MGKKPLRCNNDRVFRNTKLFGRVFESNSFILFRFFFLEFFFYWVFSEQEMVGKAGYGLPRSLFFEGTTYLLAKITSRNPKPVGKKNCSKLGKPKQSTKILSQLSWKASFGFVGTRWFCIYTSLAEEITSSQPNLFVYGEKKGMSKTI